MLPFDERASVRYAEIVSSREQIGRPIGVADAQIAAICRDLRSTLATRNIPDFEETGVQLIKPLEARLTAPALSSAVLGYHVDVPPGGRRWQRNLRPARAGTSS